MFTAALFRVVRTCKHPKCPSTEEWMERIWYTYTVEYTLLIEKNKIVSYIVTWMDPESVMQSDVGQREKKKYHILTHIGGI